MAGRRRTEHRRGEGAGNFSSAEIWGVERDSTSKDERRREHYKYGRR